jgi:hypothetical protein
MKKRFYLWISKNLASLQTWALRKSVYFSHKAVGVELPKELQ